MHPYPLPQTAGWGRQSCSHHCCTSAVGSLGGVSLCLPGRCLGAAVTELYLSSVQGRWWLLLLCSGSSEPLEHAWVLFCHARFALQPLPGSTGWEERPLGEGEPWCAGLRSLPQPGHCWTFSLEADAAQLLVGFSPSGQRESDPRLGSARGRHRREYQMGLWPWTDKPSKWCWLILKGSAVSKPGMGLLFTL